MRHRMLRFSNAVLHRLFGMLFRAVVTSLLVVACLVVTLHFLGIPLPLVDEVLRDFHHVLRTAVRG